MKLARDIWLVFGRYFGLFIRNPAWVALGVLQPVIYLVLFAPLLKSIASVQGFPPGGAYNVFVPGLRRLQPDRRAPGRCRRAVAGDAGEPRRAAPRTRLTGHGLDRGSVPDPRPDL